MKLAKVLPFMAISVALLSSCSQSANDEPQPQEGEKTQIKISASVSDVRATDTGFEAGDCIGLYVVNYSNGAPGTLANAGNHVTNMRFRYSGEWTPDSPIYWADNETPADFYIYYPYVAEVASVTTLQFGVRADQSTESAYKASDFMLGKAAGVAPTAAAITIPANHAMSRVRVYVEAGNGFTDESLLRSAVSVKINNIRCNSTINLATGSVTPTGDPVSVTPWSTGGTHKALIVPQTVDECNLITVSIDGRDYNLLKGFTFEGGKSYVFTVTVSKTSNGVNVTINPWEEDNVDHGGTAR